jgi:hypothetical protein
MRFLRIKGTGASTSVTRGYQIEIGQIGDAEERTDARGVGEANRVQQSDQLKLQPAVTLMPKAGDVERQRRCWVPNSARELWSASGRL